VQPQQRMMSWQALPHRRRWRHLGIDLNLFIGTGPPAEEWQSMDLPRQGA
jgi:hypothetical protein